MGAKPPGQLMKRTSKIENSEELIEAYQLSCLKEIKKSLCSQSKYAWIDKNVFSNENQLYLNEFLKEFETQKFVGLESALIFVNNLKQSQQINVICSATISQQICQQFQFQSKVQQIYIFCSYLPAGYVIMQKHKKVKGVCNKIQKLIRCISSYKMNESLDACEIMPRFSQLQLHAVKIFASESYITIYYFLKVFKRLQSHKDFINFVKEMSVCSSSDCCEFENLYKANLESQEIIRLYCENELFKKMLSNGMKLLKHPQRIAYLRHPMHELYYSIKYLYNQAKNRKKKKKVRQCFTVCYLSIEEVDFFFDNIGKYIVLEGFLQASLELRKETDTQNTIMTINISPVDNRQSEYDHGYIYFEEMLKISKYQKQYKSQANISEKIKSQIFSDSEDEARLIKILFNILNVFKVETVSIEIKNNMKMYTIILNQGELFDLVDKSNQKIIMNHKNQKLFQKYQQKVESIEKNIKSLQDILVILNLKQELSEEALIEIERQKQREQKDKEQEQGERLKQNEVGILKQKQEERLKQKEEERPKQKDKIGFQ